MELNEDDLVFLKIFDDAHIVEGGFVFFLVVHLLLGLYNLIL
jgi:hypothetical protein